MHRQDRDARTAPFWQDSGEWHASVRHYVRQSEHRLGSPARGPPSRHPLIPLSDENPTLRTPVMTWIIHGAMFAVWFLVEGAGNAFQMAVAVCNWGMVPGELTHQAPVGLAVPLGMGLACVVDREAVNILTPITSMFLHGG